MPFENIKISVIAPMYNEEMLIGAYIEKITQVFEHQFKLYELILIDDGSTDETVAHCLPYIEKQSVSLSAANPPKY